MTPGRWQAEVVTKIKTVPIEETTPWGETVIAFRKLKVSHVVIVKPGYPGIRFRVNRRRDRPLTFTDFREEETGTAGTAGIWGTRPMQRRGRRRSLTPRAFLTEVSHLIGSERAAEIVHTLQG